MNVQVVSTQEFCKAYKQLPRNIQKIVDDKISQLRSNPAHPSLKVHKHRKGRAQHIWICYISMSIRLLYRFINGTLYLCNVGNHNIERI